MGTIWVKEFTGGLDVRRLPETTPGGVLVRGADGHITRGGEFEKRAAFVKSHNLPPGTVGLAKTKTSLVVFGSGPRPFLPDGIAYQRLNLDDPSVTLTEVLSHDLYDGKLYVVGRFSDGSIHHFYNSNRVADWFDGRARTAFRIVGGASGGSVDQVVVDGVSVTGPTPIPWATSNVATAEAVAAAINAHTSAPDYTAYASGDTVNIVAVQAGEEPNGRTVYAETTGAITISPSSIPALSGGGTTGGTTARGSLRITAGPGTIRPAIDGVNITAAAVNWAGSTAATASRLADAINTHTSTPDYTASADDDKVIIRTAERTSALNGKNIDVTLTGSMSISNGGAKGRASFIVGPSNGVAGATLRVKIAGGSIAPPVAWATSNTATASAIAAAINGYTSSPDFTATAEGSTVYIDTVDLTAEHNGKPISFTKVGVFPTSEVKPIRGGEAPRSTMQPMDDGEDDDAFIPGTFVKTVGSKVYACAGSILHFSGIKTPRQWTTDAIGAGFTNLASENSGSEQLVAVERYQNLLAVFAPEVVQVWYVDPDPELNRQSQILNNTGTFAARSVTQFGDDDIFYLDSSGLRSLRARDSSNAASTTDIGVPVDALLTAKLAGMTEEERAAAIGLINPVDKRFWLILKDEVFVFSFYANAKVSAWTTYNLVTYVGDDEVPFTADTAVTFGERVYIRSGSRVYVYGGVSGALTYDATGAEAWLPPLDANAPTQKKSWTGVDAAVSGVWQISAAIEPTNPEFSEIVANVSETTYNMGRVTFNGSSSHIALRCRSVGEGPAVLSSVVIHYEGEADED